MRPFAEIFHRALAVIGFAYLRHGQRRERARLVPLALDRRLQHQAVHHGRQHAHGVADRTRHAFGRHLDAAENIAAADDDAESTPSSRRRHEIGGHALQRPPDRCRIPSSR